MSDTLKNTQAANLETIKKIMEAAHAEAQPLFGNNTNLAVAAIYRQHARKTTCQTSREMLLAAAVDCEDQFRAIGKIGIEDIPQLNIGSTVGDTSVKLAHFMLNKCGVSVAGFILIDALQIAVGETGPVRIGDKLAGSIASEKVVRHLNERTTPTG